MSSNTFYILQKVLEAKRAQPL